MIARVITALLIWLGPALAVMAATPSGVADILESVEPPAGVVFEIVEASPERLAPSLAAVRRDVATLRSRFPQLPVEIVTHGREQFALLREHAQRFPEAQQLSRELRDDKVELSVCGVHAERHGKTPEDFMSEIDVAAEGPARIRDLENLGYVRIRVRAPLP